MAKGKIVITPKKKGTLVFTPKKKSPIPKLKEYTKMV